jgi:predicted metal-dependent phosphotriesterase family hydrolase
MKRLTAATAWFGALWLAALAAASAELPTGPILVQTVDGPVAADEPGVVLPHEHVFTDLRGPTTAGYGQAEPEDVVRVMDPLLVQAKNQGVRLLIECTSIGVGRNVGVIQRLAQESGLALVIPTGVYGRANFAPPEHRGMTEDALTELFVRELREGIEGTGVRVGFLSPVSPTAAPRSRTPTCWAPSSPSCAAAEWTTPPSGS